MFDKTKVHLSMLISPVNHTYQNYYSRLAHILFPLRSIFTYQTDALPSMLEAGDDSTMPGSAAPAVKMEQSQPSRLSSRIMARSPTRLPSMQPVQRPLIEQLPSQPPRVPPPSQPPPLPPGSDDATDAKDEVKSEKAADDVEMDAKPDTEVPGRPTREVTRFGEAPPSEGLAPSPASLMPEQSAPLSAMRGAAGDIGDVREDEQAGAAYDPKSCPIQSEKIPITTIYRPDLMPDRVEGSIAPVVEYDMTSVPVYKVRRAWARHGCGRFYPRPRCG